MTITQVTLIDNFTFMTTFENLVAITHIKKGEMWYCRENQYNDDRVLIEKGSVALNIPKSDIEKYFAEVEANENNSNTNRE